MAFPLNFLCFFFFFIIQDLLNVLITKAHILMQRKSKWEAFGLHTKPLFPRILRLVYNVFTNVIHVQTAASHKGF